MTRFTHHVYHGIGSEMVTADGLVLRDVEYARSVVEINPNIALPSSGVEAVAYGMRSTRSARDRQHLADEGSRMMAQAPDRNNNHQTRPRVPGRGYPGQELPSPHSPPQFLGVTDQGWSSRSAFPGFTRPGGCVMGKWHRATGRRPFFWINVKHGCPRGYCVAVLLYVPHRLCMVLARSSQSTMHV